jgi:formylglycine-generating enzyme required for sulfatase activity/energy-coupling factor transporter ATP-binding protein EcfA2
MEALGMKMKKLLQMLCLAGFMILPTLLHAQQQSNFGWTDAIPWAIAAAALIFAVYKYVIDRIDKKKEKKKKIRQARTDEDIYCAALEEELGTIDMLGSPDIESKTVKLEDAFVSLRISEYWRSEERFNKGGKIQPFDDRHLTPGQVMERAFKKHRLLLIIGDPGSGKTTLLKYYAVKCLDKINKKYRELGFEREIMPMYFPLRELEFDEKNNPLFLHECLGKWSEKHILDIPAEQFKTWLKERKTLVLLDGLDEISSKEQRRIVCRWVKDMCSGLKNAYFVVASRATGYRKLDLIELEPPHLRADIMDFSSQQQEDFLGKWFRAVYCAELQPMDSKMTEQEWRQRQKKLADQRSKTIIDFLKQEENKAVQELAAVPMLLQIMASIWKKQEYLPKTRAALYDKALDHLLEYRDQQRGIAPLLMADESRRVLAPTALWMQKDLQRDEAPKEKMHQTMQPILDTLQGQHKALDFCGYLRDRAGVIADYDREHYVFRHKSFREFLCGLQLVKLSGQQKTMNLLIKHFKEDWWEESLRFFMSKSDDEIFDRFMRGLFKSKISQELDAHRQTLLEHLVREAPQKKIHALKDHLNSDSLDSRQRRYVMDCLKTIGTPEAIKTIENADKSKLDESNLSYAEDIVAEAAVKPGAGIEKPVIKEPLSQDAFRNIVEGNVEYIKIPGATYQYSVSKKMVTIPDLFFCKYPVTNKRYRRFISFLANKEKELEKKLPLAMFAERLLEFAGTIKGYSEYIGKDFKQWQSKLRSEYDDNKKFNGDDQPVVGVSWYEARSYCFWLSCLEAAITGDRQLLDGDIDRLTSIYRLPVEEEWEWAAGGEADGSTRQYPWPKDKVKPDQNLANYGEHVGATTPVDRYPEGATPLGLMDMAGNVWEWMENYYDKDKNSFALRGGSWYTDDWSLACSSRINLIPHDIWYSFIGFRVVRVSPPVI